MNFAYIIEGEQIYLHGAMAGRKYELMKKNGVCSFEMDCGHQMELLPQFKDVTMRYKSVQSVSIVYLLRAKTEGSVYLEISDIYERQRPIKSQKVKKDVKA